MKNNRPFDVLSVGEYLIDLMSVNYANSLLDIKEFERIPGGSPANLSINLARLGNNTKLVATIGKDDLGHYLLDHAQQFCLNCSSIRQIKKPTTLILVTRSKAVANFEAYRGADCHISALQLKDTLLKNVSIFHTTCFALSKKPAQTNILIAAKKAATFDCLLSIDLNYAQKIWPNRIQAQTIIAQYCKLGAVVKVSDVDFHRLYQQKITNPKKVLQHFLDLGASEVCLTLGSEGCWVANAQSQLFLPSRKIEVVDTTGAGDAFWSGYLTALLDGHTLLNRAKAGRKMAEMKISQIGSLPLKIDRSILYQDFNLSEHHVL